MTLTLPSEIEPLIDERVRSGKYQSAEEFVVAAIYSLECWGDQNSTEWDQLLAEGESSGPPLDGEAVLLEVRAIRAGQNAK
jgi:Arc/MetJ-type ribon-helix-helix transcriptional regulator